MASSYTPNLRFTLPVQGELAASWGNTVNTGITELVDSAVSGTATVALTTTSYTLTYANGSADEARQMFLTFTGTPGGAATVVCPSSSKLYYVTNSTNVAVTLKTLLGSGITLPVNARTALYCNGISVFDAETYLSSVTLGAALGVSSGGTGVATLTGIAKGSGTSAFTAATANTDYLIPALANTAVSGFKTATFNSQTVIATTTGSITIDWSTAQNQKQTEPTGTITYTFTAPPGICHLQLFIDSDGTSTAQTINWPASVIWLGSTWVGVNNKKAIINFWYDGTNYYAQGGNQV